MALKVHWLQHARHETLGCMAAWLEGRGHKVSCTRLYAGERLPPVRRLDWLLVLGGPMNIYQFDKYPWLAPEREFINDAIVKNKQVLGFCLGAQLIADVLGGKTRPNDHKEIGFFDVVKDDDTDSYDIFSDMPKRFQAFHWHGDTFEIPPGAVRHHKSDACVNQSFSWGPRVLAMQFHLEVTRPDAQVWLDLASPKVERYVQSRRAILGNPGRFRSNHRQLLRILHRLERRQTTAARLQPLSFPPRTQTLA